MSKMEVRRMRTLAEQAAMDAGNDGRDCTRLAVACTGATQSVVRSGMTRYEFCDGSAIVEHNGAWDVTYIGCNCWSGGGHDTACESTKIITTHDGHELDLDTLAVYMDDELREQLHLQLAPCEPQEFYDAYVDAHRERFGENFEVN